MVADALSRKTHYSLNAMTIVRLEILRDLENLGIELVFPGKPRSFLGSLVVQPTLLDEIKQAQAKDEEVKRIRESLNKRKAFGFVEDELEIIKFQH